LDLFFGFFAHDAKKCLWWRKKATYSRADGQTFELFGVPADHTMEIVGSDTKGDRTWAKINTK
jgi:hypothetical protein